MCEQPKYPSTGECVKTLWCILLFSHQVMSDSLRPYRMQHSRLPCPSPSLGVYPSSCPLNRWCHPAISSVVLLPSIFFNIRVFSSESALCIRWPEYWSFSFSISPSVNILVWFPLGFISLLSKSPRDSQESSPAPQFKNINSSALSLLLTSIQDY